MTKDFMQLDVYIKTRELLDDVFKLIKTLPKIEQFNLQDQLNRSSSSIFFNLSEGLGRNHSKDKIKFLYIARSFAFETISQLELCLDRNNFNQLEFEKLTNKLNDILKMINGLIGYLKNCR